LQSPRFTATHIAKLHEPTLNPKLVKECVFPAHVGQDSAAKLKNKMTENKEKQAVTRGIKNRGLSGYTNVLPRIKFGVTGQDSSPQSPTISYRQTLGTIKQNPTL